MSKQYRDIIKRALTPDEIGVSMLMSSGKTVSEVSELTGWSRQWVYKLIDSYESKISCQNTAHTHGSCDQPLSGIPENTGA